MNKIHYLILVLMSSFVISCVEEQDDAEVKKPVIGVSETDLTIDPDGGSVRIAFQVENAVDGVSVTAEAADSWIENLTVKSRILEFTVGRNETGAFRNTTVLVKYEGAEDVAVSVSQEQWEVPITLTVLDTDATSVTFTVGTSSEDLTWIGQIVGKEWWDSFDGEQAVFEADLAYFASEASYYGVSLKQYISEIMIKGSREGLKYTRLDPLSDYILYVYGITPEGERTTSLYSASIRTSEPYEGPITFSFDIDETDAVMDVTVTPSHDGVDYYWNMTTPEALAEFGTDTETAIAAWLAAELKDVVDDNHDYADRAEFFEYNTTKNEANSVFEGIVNTDYIFFAFKWNADCEIVGDIAYVEYATGDVTPSDNQISVTVSNLTQTSMHVEAVTTNSDPYFLYAEPVADIERSGIDLGDDDQVFHYFYDWLGTFYIWSYINNGNMGGDFKELSPDTEYYVVTFGYKSGALTTDVQIQKVKTLPLGEPKDCTFEFEISNLKTTSAEVTITPSDKGYYYYWDIYPASMTANMIKQAITRKFNDEYYGDMWDFRKELSLSDDHGYLSYLTPDTDYKIAAILVDYDPDATGLEFLSVVHSSPTFHTPEQKQSSTSVTCGFNEYYNGDEISALEPNKFGGMAGYPWFYLTIDIDGDYSSYYYTIFEYVDGLEDPEKYPDSELYYSLLDKGWCTSTTMYFRAVWDTPLMIAAMAVDLEGNYTTIYRQKFTLTKSGTAPAENFINRYGVMSVSKASRQKSEVQAFAARPEAGPLLKRKVKLDR